jgi:predicted transcriptional regulator
MSNNINADWAEQQHQIQLDKMAGVDDDTIARLETPEADPDYEYEVARDNNL